MTELSKERRDAIRREMDDPSVDFEPYDTTVRALLDMADERDRYRAALEEIAGMHGCCQTEGCSTEHPMCDTMIAHAALEGKNND